MSKGSKFSMLFFAGMSALMGFCSFVGGHACGQMDRMEEEKEYLDSLSEEISKKED